MSRRRLDPTRPPAEQLAQRIIDRLVEEKLLTSRDAKRMVGPLADGELSAEDWQLPLDVSDEKGGK